MNKHGLFRGQFKFILINSQLPLKISTVLSVLSVSLIPFLTLMVLNHLIYRTIKKKTFIVSNSARRAHREFHIATILISIVSLFGLCHILKFFINMLELVCVLIGEHGSRFLLNLKTHLCFSSFTS